MTANENQVPEETSLDTSSQQRASAAANVNARDVTIVGMGASTDGLETLEVFFEHVPSDAGVCFVVITHQHPDHTSLLPELLDRTLRQPAEQILHTTRSEVSAMDTEQVQRLVHELQVHQIELQMQNEELLAQQELARSLDKFSHLYDFAPVGYLTVDEAGVISQANLTAASILQVDRQSLALRPFSDWVARDSQDVWHLHRRQVLAGHERVSCELTLRRFDNSPCVIRLESQAVSPQPSETGRFLMAMLDITQEKDALKWEVQATRLQQLVEHLPAGAVFVGREGIEMNRTAEFITGYSREELPDVDQWFSKLYGARATENRQLYNAERRTGFSQKSTCTITRRDGTKRLVEFAAHGFDDHEVWFMHDITEQWRYNQVMEAMASGASLADVLQLVVELAQESLPGSLGAILVLDQSTRRLHLGHTAGLPPTLIKAIDGLHTDIDRCGCTQAAVTGQCVVVEDITASSEHTHYGRLAQSVGLQACWCQPIIATSGEILGTFTLYFTQPRVPTPNELGVLEHAAQLAGIAIERASAGERIRISEERLRLVTQASTDAIWDYNVVDETVWWNNAYAELFGRPPDAKTLDWWESRVHPDDRERTAQSLRAFATGEGDSELWTAEYRFQRVAGDFAYVIDRALRSRDASGKTVRVVGSLYDLTERRKLEQQVLDIVVHERRRIGNDLHDGLGQELTGLSMVADSLITALSRKSLPEVRLAEKLNVGLQRALVKTRLLARGLNPVDIDARGLLSALEEMAVQIRDVYHVDCIFRCEQDIVFRKNQTATQLFRIAQEATTNALRHGRAKHIAINLASLGDWAELRIVDDGIGFPSHAPAGQGMGLRIMHYRAGLFGGQLHVGPAPGGGTQVLCRVPSSALLSPQDKRQPFKS